METVFNISAWLTTVPLLPPCMIIVGDYPHEASSTYSLLIVSPGHFYPFLYGVVLQGLFLTTTCYADHFICTSFDTLD